MTDDQKLQLWIVGIILSPLAFMAPLVLGAALVAPHVPRQTDDVKKPSVEWCVVCEADK